MTNRENFLTYEVCSSFIECERVESILDMLPELLVRETKDGGHLIGFVSQLFW